MTFAAPSPRLPVLVAALTVVAAAFANFSAAAQPAPATGERMVVEAKELVYDEKRNTVTARGDVQIYYKGRLLEADRVTYDRNT
ncbi:MAG: hypothetical protein FJX16_04200, partial [Alphaproteobacteria bacterium]|nr:hypothetical protein [Alphaproteobacteria bacterium]